MKCRLQLALFAIVLSRSTEDGKIKNLMSSTASSMAETPPTAQGIRATHLQRLPATSASELAGTAERENTESTCRSRGIRRAANLVAERQRAMYQYHWLKSLFVDGLVTLDCIESVCMKCFQKKDLKIPIQ